MRFRIALHDLFTGPPDPRRLELRAFYERLFDALSDRGHTVERHDDVYLPPPDPASVTLGYHSRGRAPRTWHIKPSYLRQHFYIDRDGYSGWSEMARNPDLFRAAMAEPEADALAYVAALRSRYFDAGLSKLSQPAQRYAWDGQPYVFLPLQVLGDRVLQLARIDYAELARRTAAALAGSGYRLVLKRHPRCQHPDSFRLLAELSALPHVQVTAGAIHDLLANASAVACFNSGVGFEALFYGRQVFTAGHSDYEGVTTPLADVAALDDLPRRLAPPDPGRLARFLSYFCRRYLVPAPDPQALERRLDQMEQDAEDSLRNAC